MRKGAEKPEIAQKVFLFRINPNKETTHKSTKNIKTQTQNLI